MAWTIVGVGSVPTPVASGNYTLTEPAGVQQGDLLVACISYRSTPAFTLPTGWSLVASQQSSGDVDATDGIASGLMAYIVRGSSAPALTFTRTAGDVAMGRIVAYRGVNQADPYQTGTANTLGAVSATVTTGTIDTANPDTLLIVAGCGGDNYTWSAFDAATDPTTASGASDTTTAPTRGTWIERGDSGTNTGADTSLAVADALRAAPGSTGTIQATSSGAGRSVLIAGAFRMEEDPLGRVSSQIHPGRGSSPAGRFFQTPHAYEAGAATPVLGDLSATDPVETLSGAATTSVAGALSATDSVETTSGTGTADVSGALTATDPGETLSGVATAAVSASLSAADPVETLSAAASVTVGASLSATDPVESLSGAGSPGATMLVGPQRFSYAYANPLGVYRLGWRRIALRRPFVAAADISQATEVIGTLSATDPVETLSGAGTVNITASAALTDPVETLSGVATVAVAAAASVIDPVETLSGAAAVAVTASLSVTDPVETLGGTATAAIVASASITDPVETLSGSGTAGVAASLSVADPVETLSGAAAVAVVASLAATDPVETLSGVASVATPASGALSATDPVETLSGAATVTVTASATPTDPVETLSGAASIAVAASLSATDPAETLAGAATLQAVSDGNLAVTDPVETLSGAASVAVAASASLTDPVETLGGIAAVTAAGTLAAADPVETLAGVAKMSGDLVHGRAFDPVEGMQGRATVTGRGNPGAGSAIPNTILPPPRLTGNAEQDVAALSRWCSTLYDHLVREANVVGVVTAMIRRVRADIGPNADVASEFMRVLSEIDQIKREIAILLEGD